MDLTNKEQPPYKNLSLEDMTGEVWRPLLNYEHQYMVSNMGRVKGLSGVIKGANNSCQYLKERIMSQGINSTGYCVTRRTFLFNGKQTNLVHRLIAHSFLIKKDDGRNEINHISGDKKDNRVFNLEWVNKQENILHAARNFGFFTGLKSGKSKFTKKQVLDIYFSDLSNRALGAKYGVSHSVIGFIKTKKSYPDVVKNLPNIPRNNNKKQKAINNGLHK